MDAIELLALMALVLSALALGVSISVWITAAHAERRLAQMLAERERWRIDKPKFENKE